MLRATFVMLVVDHVSDWVDIRAPHHFLIGAPHIQFMSSAYYHVLIIGYEKLRTLVDEINVRTCNWVFLAYRWGVIVTKIQHRVQSGGPSSDWVDHCRRRSSFEVHRSQNHESFAVTEDSAPCSVVRHAHTEQFTGILCNGRFCESGHPVGFQNV